MDLDRLKKEIESDPTAFVNETQAVIHNREFLAEILLDQVDEFIKSEGRAGGLPRKVERSRIFRT